jgi:hypothetical protein
MRRKSVPDFQLQENSVNRCSVSCVTSRALAMSARCAARASGDAHGAPDAPIEVDDDAELTAP